MQTKWLSVRPQHNLTEHFYSPRTAFPSPLTREDWNPVRVRVRWRFASRSVRILAMTRCWRTLSNHRHPDSGPSTTPHGTLIPRRLGRHQVAVPCSRGLLRSLSHPPMSSGGVAALRLCEQVEVALGAPRGNHRIFHEPPRDHGVVR